MKTDYYDIVPIRTAWTWYYALAYLIGGFVGLVTGYSMFLVGVVAVVVMWQYREVQAERQEKRVLREFRESLDNMPTNG